MKQTRRINERATRLAGRLGLVVLPLLVIGALHGQTISDINPASAAQGDTLVVTFTLDGGTLPAPPAGAPPSSVTLGTLAGTDVTHDSQAIVTARFRIPPFEEIGWKDATVVFTPPQGDPLTFSSAAAFEITTGPGLAADFSATPRSGTAPLTVAFADASAGTITGWLWDFGDGATSPEVQPEHTYTDPGRYTVSLTVSGANGSHTTTRAHYISVLDSNVATPTVAYPIVTTGQTECYNHSETITPPASGEPFYGQDAQFPSLPFNFTDNGDGTVTDHNTGLTWQKTPDGTRMPWAEAKAYCESLELGGHDDWRMPTLKELFSISDFSEGWPYLDTTYFDLAGATVSKDEQYWADNYYVGVTAEGGTNAAFGVNHATGHIKAYPAGVRGPMAKVVRAVRGNRYGINDFLDNGDGTITDRATGLMWARDDSGKGMDWEQALAWAQAMNAAHYLGHSDWRLPNVKELQSIVDYTRSPNATDPAHVGPAVDPLFHCTSITNEAGDADYPYYWTSTSARFNAGDPFYYAWYVAAGRAVNPDGQDAHGAGAVRFDAKIEGGPAGEGGERYDNFVRLVRNADTVKDSYAVVDTGQDQSYDTTNAIASPAPGDAFSGQDAQYTGHQPSYTLSADGLTVHDNVTGLTWQRSPDTDGDGDIDASDKLTWAELQTYPDTLNAVNFGGFGDWRLPTIKELYSLIDFRGTDPAPEGTDTSALRPFIDINYFDFAYGDTSAGERIIDSQYASSTLYVADNQTLFGVNFADGRIKGYGLTLFGRDKTFFVMCCRGNPSYGQNEFVDHGDGTITDRAAGLMWQQADSGEGMTWEDALAYAENLELGGYRDWRLPNAKELQSLVDYTRSPDTTSSGAIDPLFTCSTITNLAGVLDYPFYWSSTTHRSAQGDVGRACYVAFGRGLGTLDGGATIIDIHGAGCQRSDPKTGDPNDYPSSGNGPQGDVSRVFNHVRCVRGGASAPDTDTDADGLSDWYEYNYSGSPTGMVADADNDHDLASNKNERLAGTSPTNPNSVFFISQLSADDDTVVVTWSSALGKTYALQQCTNLTDGVWTTVQSGIRATPPMNSHTAASAASPVFFRVVVE